MKTIFFFAALLLGGAAHAQTTPTTTSPAQMLPPPPIGTIDTTSGSLPTTQQPRQDRVRNRQTVMDGKASPGVETKQERRAPRTKKARPAATDPQ